MKEKKILKKFSTEKLMREDWIKKYSKWTSNCKKLDLFESLVRSVTLQQIWADVVKKWLRYGGHTLNSCTVFLMSILVLLMSWNILLPIVFALIFNVSLIKFVKDVVTIMGIEHFYWLKLFNYFFFLILYTPSVRENNS